MRHSGITEVLVFDSLRVADEVTPCTPLLDCDHSIVRRHGLLLPDPCEASDHDVREEWIQETA